MENKTLLQDLASGFASRASIQKKEADNVVRNIFDIIIQYLQEDKIVKIKGLGTFKVIEVSGRDSVNVNTGERIHISGHSKVTFSPDPALRDQVNRPFADFETIVINDGADMEELERLPEPETEEPDEEEGAAIADDAEPTVAPEPTEAPLPVEATEPEEAPEESAETVPSTPTESVVSDSAEEPVMPVIQPTSEESPKTESAQEETAEPGARASEVESAAEPVEEGKEGETDHTTVEETEAPKDTNSDEGNGNDTSSDDLTNNSKVSDKEKIVYIEKRPCRFCRTCFVLLTLALMALSYLAGAQQWFACTGCTAKQDAQEVKAEPKKEVVENVKPAAVVDTLQQDSLSQKVEEAPVATEAKPEVPTASSTLSANTASQQPSASASSTASQNPSKPSGPVTSANNAAQAQSLPDGNYEIVGTKCQHTMKSGEGLYRLARMYYGNKEMARYIIKYNNISNPDIVSEGSVIKIPELKRVGK